MCLKRRTTYVRDDHNYRPLGPMEVLWCTGPNAFGGFHGCSGECVLKSSRRSPELQHSSAMILLVSPQPHTLNPMLRIDLVYVDCQIVLRQSSSELYDVLIVKHLFSPRDVGFRAPIC